MILSMTVNFLKSILHNIGVVLGSLGLAYLCSFVDFLLQIPTFSSLLTNVCGWVLLMLGFLTRLWATFHFYNHSMRVISLVPQNSLITSGPYRYSRNPLYLGGNVFCFFGAALALGSPTALLLTTVHLPFVNLMIRREEKQLELKFGQEFRAYTQHVRRWL